MLKKHYYFDIHVVLGKLHGGSRYVDTWLSGYVDTWLSGYVDTWLCRGEAISLPF